MQRFVASRLVNPYEDAERSGVSLHWGNALQTLLADVITGRTDYGTILVYDISRWGRFQDSDESAHYEYLCRQAGVRGRWLANLAASFRSRFTPVKVD